MHSRLPTASWSSTPGALVPNGTISTGSSPAEGEPPVRAATTTSVATASTALHLIQVPSPKPAPAALWRRRAAREVAEQVSRGHVRSACGGSGRGRVLEGARRKAGAGARWWRRRNRTRDQRQTGG